MNSTVKTGKDSQGSKKPVDKTPLSGEFRKLGDRYEEKLKGIRASSFEELGKLIDATLGNRVVAVEGEISILTTAHGGLSRKQTELEGRQRSLEDGLDIQKKRLIKELRVVNRGIKRLSEGFAGVRKRDEELSTRVDGFDKKLKEEVQRLEGLIGGKPSKDGVTKMINDAIHAHDDDRDLVLDTRYDGKYIPKTDAETFASTAALADATNAMVAAKDAAQEAVTIAKAAHSMATEAEAKAHGAFDRANGFSDRISEVDGAVERIRTSLPPGAPANGPVETPAEAKKAPEAVDADAAIVDEIVEAIETDKVTDAMKQDPRFLDAAGTYLRSLEKRVGSLGRETILDILVVKDSLSQGDKEKIADHVLKPEETGKAPDESQKIDVEAIVKQVKAEVLKTVRGLASGAESLEDLVDGLDMYIKDNFGGEGESNE